MRKIILFCVAIWGVIVLADEPRYVVSIACSPEGTVWAGTDGDGLWRSEDNAKTWQRDLSYEEEGGTCAFNLCYDTRGRLWAGSLANGVVVYSGGRWKAYNAELGFPGSRVFALAADRDGGMWIASDSGLAHYDEAKSQWRFWTRECGLLENEILAIACNLRNGDVVIGYASKGVAIGNSRNAYSRWHHYPMTSQVNCLLCDERGCIAVGMAEGLAISVGKGSRLTFTDVGSKGAKKSDNDMVFWLSSPEKRYVTCVAKGAQDGLLVATREGGVYLYDRGAESLKQLLSPTKCKYPTSIARSSDGIALIGMYGFGTSSVSLKHEGKGREKTSETTVAKHGFPVAPSGWQNVCRTVSDGGVSKIRNRSAPVFYLRDDWETKGDWWGRYGQRWATLCSMYAQWGDEEISAEIGGGYRVVGRLGAKNRKCDGVRHWLHWLSTDNRNSLWLHSEGIRRQAEWDDHGEAYSRGFGGPNLFVRVRVPEGRHDVAFYFFNKDGREGVNYCRDYLMEVSRYNSRLSSYSSDGAHEYPELDSKAGIYCSTRVKDFHNGVYKVFRVIEAGEYLFKINRGTSHNAILSGVFVSGAHEAEEMESCPFLNTAYMTGGVVYKAPHLEESVIANKAGEAFDRSRCLLETAVSGEEYDRARETMARLYARIQASPACNVLENIRWKLFRWTKEDRDKFDRYLMLGWTGRQMKYQRKLLRSQALYAKNTIEDGDFGDVISNWNFKLEDWYGKVPSSRRCYVEEPCSNFWKNAVYSSVYRFREPVAQFGRSVKYTKGTKKGQR